MGGYGHTYRRKSMAKGSVENVVTVLRSLLGVDPRDYDIHVNFPGGVPMDGPSAGLAIACAIYSALTQRPLDNRAAVTGEISIRGTVRPVGGLVAKLEAARQAGARRVLIPRENWQEMFAEEKDLEIVPVDTLEEALRLALVDEVVQAAVEARAPAAREPAAEAVPEPAAASSHAGEPEPGRPQTVPGGPRPLPLPAQTVAGGSGG